MAAGDLSWGQAAWQAVACAVASIPLLLTVLAIIGLPKHLNRPSRSLVKVIGLATSVLQFVVPWAGWAALLWMLNGDAMSWGTALRSGGAIALFSYATGAALTVRCRPRPSDVEVTRLDVPIPALPQSFDEYRILHVSDMHAGSFLSAEEAGRRLAAADGLRPDLAVFTGDLAAADSNHIASAADLLARLDARDGVVAVLGNHDVWAGEKHVRGALAERGVTVLANGHIPVARGEDVLYLAGVGDDAYTSRADLGAAFAGIPDGAAAILLSHAPAIVRRPLAARAALVLSGHTHGGQIVLPYVGPVYVPSRLGRRYASGLHRYGTQWLFITRGLGEVFPPLRVGCPPEVALLTLRRAPPD